MKLGHSLPEISKIIGEEWQKLNKTQKDVSMLHYVPLIIDFLIAMDGESKGPEMPVWDQSVSLKVKHCESMELSAFLRLKQED